MMKIKINSDAFATVIDVENKIGFWNGDDTITSIGFN